MAAFQGDAIFWIETEKIVPNPFQPRREFDQQKLQELAESIRMYGVLQPLTVTRREVHGEDGAFRTEYELIAGERRLRASKLAGVEQVPVIIREGEESEQEKLELAIIENLQREDLNAVDRALAFRQLADTFNLSHAQVAKKVGRSREYVSNSIRLLNLPEYMLDSVKTADISEGHARTLLMLNERPEEQDTLYREILLKKLTVREVERIARKIATDKVRKQVWKGTDPELIEKEKQFTETLGTRVQLTKTDYGGKITIDYFSDEDLDVLLAVLSQQHAANQANVAGGSMSPMTSAAAAVSAAGTTQALQDLTTATPLMSDAVSNESDAIDFSSDTPSEPLDIHEVLLQKSAVDTTNIHNNLTPSTDTHKTPTHNNESNEQAVAEDADTSGFDQKSDETQVANTPDIPSTPPDSVNGGYSVVGSVPAPAHTHNDAAESSMSPLRAKLAQLFSENTSPRNESIAGATPAPVATEPTPQTAPAVVESNERVAQEPLEAEQPKRDDDEDLYGIKNFNV